MTEDPLTELAYTPKLRLHLNDLTHEATNSFLTLIDCKTLIPNTIKQILKHLYVPYGREKVPRIRSITLTLRDMGGVAYTTGIEIDDQHKEIHVSLAYLGSLCKDPLRFRDEVLGVIQHEMVHCFQHNCEGTAPGGLVEGIADFVRLKAGRAPPHWKKEKDQLGDKWDEGYQKTAWFLEWLEDVRGAGTVSRMNEMMGRCKYEEDKFWPELFGMKISVLWKLYKATWKEGDDEETTTDQEPKSSTSTEKAEDKEGSEGTEPEVVDLNAAEKEQAELALRPHEWKA